MSVSRRNFLKVGGLGALGVAGVGIPLGQSARTASVSKLPSSLMPRPFGVAFARPPVLQPTSTGLDADGVPTNYYTVSERAGTARIAGNLSTPVYAYNGSVPGPTIELDKGTRAVLRVRNQLPLTHPQFGHTFKTSVHLHGSASKPQYDGYADDVTPPNFYKDYYYPNMQPARTLWYHDHGVHHTAQNAYGGLAAQYHIHDEAERALLPQGRYDVPVTVSDVMFAADGSLAYDDRTHSGLYGDVILVNGRPWPVMKVKRRIYRFRILNASISRGYRFRLSTGDPVTMVATDGGLMPKSQQVGSWRHGNAERYEILVDFRKYAVGTRIELQNLGLTNVVNYDFTGKIMRFDVSDDATVDASLGGPDGPEDRTISTLPTLLVNSTAMGLSVYNSVKTRSLRVQRNAAGEWTINDKTWRDVVDSGYSLVQADPNLDDVEIWEIENRSGGWFHPVHIHLVDFKILSRNGLAPYNYEMGPKDVVYVGENEKVRLLMKFEHQRGKYMIHCHNLPHEDHDMMQQFSVGLKAGDVDYNDPIKADPCKWDNLPQDA